MTNGALALGAAVLLSSCRIGYEAAGADTVDAPVTDGGDGHPDAPSILDAAGERADALAPPTPCGGLAWESHFDGDPTSLDANADGIPDWTRRGGGSFPIDELDGGIWHASAGVALDTNPKVDFAGETRAWVRMQPRETGAWGAIFWVNADWTDGAFAPIYVAVTLRESGEQDLTLYGKTDDATPVPLLEVLDIGADLMDVALIVDAPSDRVSLWVEQTHIGTVDYLRYPISNDDRFATVIGFGTAADFDHVRVEHCQ